MVVKVSHKRDETYIDRYRCCATLFKIHVCLFFTLLSSNEITMAIECINIPINYCTVQLHIDVLSMIKMIRRLASFFPKANNPKYIVLASFFSK